MILTETDAAELARWHVGKQTIPEWLESGPSCERVQAMLVRLLDRTNGGVGSVLLGQVLARYIGADTDALYAEHYPRKAARLATECRERGDHPHAERLHAALVRLMFCANCGRPLADPLSIERGIGPDCWHVIEPAWRTAIDARLATPATATVATRGHGDRG